MCKPDIAVNEVGLLADVGTWLKESTCATVSSSERVRAASARAALCTDMHFLDPLHVLLPLHLRISAPICFSPFPTHRPHNGQVSLSDNVTAVLLPTHQLFAIPPANLAKGNGRCAPTPRPLTRPTHHQSQKGGCREAPDDGACAPITDSAILQDFLV